jgi:hypothetical protein
MPEVGDILFRRTHRPMPTDISSDVVQPAIDVNDIRGGRRNPISDPVRNVAR